MATRYWVGGTGTWDASSTTYWSTTSGGASGASAPTSADTVNFDSNSGTGTCTTASGAAAAVVTLNSSTLGLTLGASLTNSGTFTLTLGTLSLASYTLTCQIFSSTNSNIRSIAFGTGNISITGNAATVLNMATATNFTYTGTPTVNLTYSGATGTRTITMSVGASETNAVDIYVTAGSDIVATNTSFFAGTLSFSGFSGTFTRSANNIVLYRNLVLGTSMTYTAVANAILFSGTVASQQNITSNSVTINSPLSFLSTKVQLQDNLTVSSAYTVTLSSGILDLSNKTLSTGLFSSSNSNTRSILFGTGNITVVGTGNVWSTTTPTNFTYTGTPTVNISNNSATATTVSTGALTETQALNFNYTVGTYTLTDTSAVYKNLNFTGFTGTIPNSVRTIYGNTIFVSGMTLTAGTNATTFAATSGTQQITTASKTLDFPLTFNGVGGTFAFQDALTQGSTRAFTFTNGTLQLKSSVTSTVGAFATSGTTVKYLSSSIPGTQATISQASGIVNATYLTIQDSNATGGATWNSFLTNKNVNLGNNTNWNFGNNFFFMFG
jgi:hypothetical protein